MTLPPVECSCAGMLRESDAAFRTIQIGTGHEFYGLMDEMQQGGAMYVVVYFFSFYTVSVFMLTNIFVAVVLENFEVCSVSTACG